MNFSQHLEFILLLSPLLLTTGLIISLTKWKELNKLEKAITFYLFIALLADIVSRLMPIFLEDNLVIVPIFGVFELLVFAHIYFRILFKNRSRWLLIVLVMGFAFTFLEIFQISRLTGSYCRGINSLIIVLMSMYRLYEIYRVETSQEVGREVRFNGSVLLFFSFNALFYIPFDFLVHVPSMIKFYFWTAHIAVLILFYINLNIFQWKAGENRK